ncbi:alditol oxidase [soil metagenome]
MSTPAPAALGAVPGEPASNWAQNVTFGAPVQRPRTVPEVQDLVAGAQRAHAVGTGHSFSAVADTRGVLLSLTDLPRHFDVAPGRDSVSVNGAMTFSDLGPLLHDEGLALHNLGSLPHISLAGACSTGTHGAGDRVQCLAAAVCGVEVVTASGELAQVRRGDPDFAGMVLSLGTTGIITALSMDVQPAYDVAQTIWQGIDLATGIGDLDAILASAYSVGVFTTLQPTSFGEVWVKRRMDEPDPDLSRWGGRPAAGAVRPVPGERGEGCTIQGGIPGAWFERLPHFTPDVPPSASGAELQSEYYVGRSVGPMALEALWRVAPDLRAALRVCELRSVAADGLWLSPAYERDLLGIHFTWKLDAELVRAACRRVEQALEPFQPVPHWGKISQLEPAAVAARFARMEDMRRLVGAVDPDNVFGNGTTDRYLRPGEPAG